MGNNFDFEVKPNKLMISYKNSFDFTIKNNSGTDILVNNDLGSTGDKYPDIDDVLTRHDPRGFYIYFPYGSGATDAATVEESANIEMTIKTYPEAPNWNIYKRTSSTKGVYFIVYPTNSTIFTRGKSMVLSIKVQCNATVGETVINAQFENVNKATKIYKKNKPVITKFQPKEYYFENNSIVHMEWALSDGEDCKLFFNDTIDVTDMKDYAVQLVNDKPFKLTFKTPMGYSGEKTYTPPYIVSFEATLVQKKLTAAIFREFDSDFVSVDSLKEGTYYVVPMVSYDVPPPSPKYRDVRIVWETRNTSHCKAADEKNLSSSGFKEIKVSGESITLYAVGTQGGEATKRRDF